MKMLLSLLLTALGCSGPGSDTASPCPGLDCVDSLTLTVLNPDGTAAERFGGWAAGADGAQVRFACGDTPLTDPGARCLGDGRVEVLLYGETVEVYVDQGDDAPYFTGTVTPVWEAPYDSEECGHYCYLSEASVTLDPCEGCG
jgi:hypothetical protein